MRRDPRDWRSEDVRTVCLAFGLAFDGPPRGSHHGVRHPRMRGTLTIPFARPIKPICIRRLVTLIDAVERVVERGKDG